jgi:hypothetical protein
LRGLRGALSRNNPESKEFEPTVYLIIHKPEPRNVGISWTITIRVPDGPDYMFDLLPNNTPKKGFHIREARASNVTVKSDYFKATIKIGVVPGNSSVKEHALGHVLHNFRAHKIDADKPNGISMIWVTDVLDELRRTELLLFEKGANEKIEEQIRALEKH